MYNMGWFDELVDATEEAIDEAIDVALSGELPPFGAGVRTVDPDNPERGIPGGPDDPMGQLIIDAFRTVTGVDPRDGRRGRIRGLASENQEEIAQYVRERLQRDRVTRRQIAEAINESRNMPVDYSDWISIAFDVAKSKGADFATTQKQIEAGSAPTSDAVKVFAEIWNDRKDEIRASREAARRIAREEIEA